MYVCNCAGIRESEARDAIQCGATRPALVFDALNKEPSCGKCVPDMQKLIREARDMKTGVITLAAK